MEEENVAQARALKEEASARNRALEVEVAARNCALEEEVAAKAHDVEEDKAAKINAMDEELPPKKDHLCNTDLTEDGTSAKEPIAPTETKQLTIEDVSETDILHDQKEQTQIFCMIRRNKHLLAIALKSLDKYLRLQLKRK
ncbi:uncharacterized protein LOC122037784 [Zingiber officinale]|uniref:uncharacterized protein LOC122037784 n=1 Tax=Zingiber officinale TaxID=94328 RepID=UPI001C4D9035|nr:uncharacterized protein LOC122037784 [Zingiber officinale]